jgi:transposase InsO family protein
MGKRRHRSIGPLLSTGAAPNDLGAADFKGEFKRGDGRWGSPLPVTDHAARVLLLCEAMESTREEPVITAFEPLVLDRGLPDAIRPDKGLPFASPNGLFNLSRLSVGWLRLGIAIERIRPGRPQQKGRHERMHLTLQQETARPAAQTIIQQQERFDAFLAAFNTERPHEALSMRGPAEVYTPARRPYQGLPELTSPLHDRDSLITACGRLCVPRKKINISTGLAGQRVGIKEVDEGIWLVSFMA